MAQLCHAKASSQLQCVEFGQDALMVLGSAQLRHRAPTQGEVHPRLDSQRVVRVRKGLKARQETARVCTRQQKTRQHAQEEGYRG